MSKCACIGHTSAAIRLGFGGSAVDLSVPLQLVFGAAVIRYKNTASI